MSESATGMPHPQSMADTSHSSFMELEHKMTSRRPDSDNIVDEVVDPTAMPAKPKKGLKFWMCIVSIMICSFIMTLDLSGTSTALPVIVHDLGGTQFEWVGSAYSLSATAFMPLSGSLAQVFGRRAVMLAQIFLFAVGSAMCGAAPSLNFLIAGRTIQGIGAGGINTVTQIILSDLVSLKERGTYNGFVSLGFGFATATAPVIAGALATHGQWRWFFYMNIPICGVAGVLVAVFMNLKVPRRTLKEKMMSQDWIGNFLVIASTSAVVIGLTWGGITFPWNSARVLVPLVLGNVGLVVFLVYEARYASNPVVPMQVASTWTGLSGYLQSFLAMFYLLGAIYYLPVYFQACKDASPVDSGIDCFGLAYTVVPAAIAVGISITKSGRYRLQLWLGWVFMLIGAGLFTLIHAHTDRATAICYQIVGGVGLGMLTTGAFFPVLAPLPLSLNASALALYMFLRYLSQVWAVTVGGTVLQNELKKKLPAEFINQFPKGSAIAYSIIPIIPTLEEPLKSTVQVAFAESLKVFWQVLIAVAGLGFFCCAFMKGLPLHTTLSEDHDYALKNNTVPVEGGEEMAVVKSQSPS